LFNPRFRNGILDPIAGHAELGKGIEVTITGKSNKVNERVKEAQQVTELTQTNAAPALNFNLEADMDIYFGEGELLIPPTFANPGEVFSTKGITT
jgi:hypothetical protein